jgi:PAS domain S-box-containing protein
VKPERKFDRGIRLMDKRLELLFEQVTSAPLPAEQRRLLETSVAELATAMEELHVAQEELRVQNEQLIAARMEIEQEHQRYKDLFDFAPDGYVVTNIAGTIQEANRSAVNMLNWSLKGLRGKPLNTIVAMEDRARVDEGLTLLAKAGGIQHMKWRMRPRKLPMFDADLTASVTRDGGGRANAIRWLVRDVTQTNADEQQLLDYQRRLRALASELSVAEERERRQIAVEIHDRISQNLAMAKMRLASIQSRFSPETNARVQVDFYDALLLLEQTLEDTRTLTFELSPPILYELGLVSAIQWQAEQLSKRHGIKVAVDGQATVGEALGEDLRSLLFRSVRELLINVIKHAGATAARVSIRPYEGGVRVTVADDGHGIVPAEPNKSGQTGFGLFSMRTRLEEIGGKVEISSVPDSGTRVTLFAPVDTSDSGGGGSDGDQNSTSG